MPLSITYNLAATSCPLPMTPSALLNPDSGSPTPTTMNQFAVADQAGVAAKLQRNATAADVLGRYGGGAYAILTGLTLSEGAGLTLNVAAGQAVLDGPKTRSASFTVAMTDNAQNYVWLLQDGNPSIRSDTTQPASAGVFLGRVTAAAGAITALDCSGRLELLQGNLAERRTGDTSVPTDSPPTGLRFLTRCANGGLYLWDTVGYLALAEPLSLSDTVIASGVSVTIPSGKQAVVAELDVQGTLVVGGRLAMVS